MFKKVLIANRGEIAVRIIRACQEMNIATVAVHSTADADSLAVQLADQSVCIGPPAAKESYLSIANIVSAAAITGAEAIHPGYGFLAENASFADICSQVGIAFIGPTPRAIDTMGNKAAAREAMMKANVPIVPGTPGTIADERAALSAAREIGYPVIIKASAGGGGKGMRVVKEESELATQFSMARQEAEAAFGNGEVYIEKYLIQPRHIEVQILADAHGNVVHLGERDCSVQTARHQKMIEEAPCAFFPEETRKALGEAAVAGAKAVGYTNAGTIEFLVSATGEFYFMEMNTRIQVEHPVTEQITGIDLIKAQIRVAAGEELGRHARRHQFQRPCHRMPLDRGRPGKKFRARFGHGRKLRCARRFGRARRFAPAQRLFRAAILRFAARQNHRSRTDARRSHRAHETRLGRNQIGRFGDDQRLSFEDSGQRIFRSAAKFRPTFWPVAWAVINFRFR